MILKLRAPLTLDDIPNTPRIDRTRTPEAKRTAVQIATARRLINQAKGR